MYVSDSVRKVWNGSAEAELCEQRRHWYIGVYDRAVAVEQWPGKYEELIQIMSKTDQLDVYT